MSEWRVIFIRFRKLSEDGDYTFGQSQQNFWNNVPEAVGQSVETRLLLWLGEWFLNIQDGTPYMQGILGKHGIQSADTTIQDRVLNTNGVTNIQNYASKLDPDTRVLSVELTINTIYGPTSVQIDNYGTY